MSETRTVNMVLPSDVYARLVERARKKALTPATLARHLFDAGLDGGKTTARTVKDLSEQIARLTDQLADARRDQASAEARAGKAERECEQVVEIKAALKSAHGRIAELERLAARLKKIATAMLVAPSIPPGPLAALPDEPEAVRKDQDHSVAAAEMVADAPDMAPCTYRMIRALRAKGMPPTQIARQVDLPVDAVMRVCNG